MSSTLTIYLLLTSRSISYYTNNHTPTLFTSPYTQFSDSIKTLWQHCNGFAAKQSSYYVSRQKNVVFNDPETWHCHRLGLGTSVLRGGGGGGGGAPHSAGISQRACVKFPMQLAKSKPKQPTTQTGRMWMCILLISSWDSAKDFFN